MHRITRIRRFAAALIAALAAAPAALASDGTDFWFALPRAHQGRVFIDDSGTQRSVATEENTGHEIVVHASEPGTRVTIETPIGVEGAGFAPLFAGTPLETRDLPVEPLSPLLLRVPFDSGAPVQIGDATAVENKAIHLRATKPVSVVVYDWSEEHKLGNGAFRVLPTPSLERDYRLTVDPPEAGKAVHLLRRRFLVVATQDNTSVEITPPPRGAEPHRVGQSIVLNRGQVYQEVMEGSAAEGTGYVGSGATVRASKPVAVLSSCPVVYVEAFSHDSIVEQQIPLADWGTDYLIPQVAPGWGACCLNPDGACVALASPPECCDVSGRWMGPGTTCEPARCETDPGLADPMTAYWSLRVVTSQPDTHVTVLTDSPDAARGWQRFDTPDPLDAGEILDVIPGRFTGEDCPSTLDSPYRDGFLASGAPLSPHELKLNYKPVRVLADKPVSVTIFCRSEGTRQPQATAGDPFQMNALPSSLFRDSALLTPLTRFRYTHADAAVPARPADEALTHLLLLVAPSSETGSVRLDGQPLTDFAWPWTPFPNSNPLAPATHSWAAVRLTLHPIAQRNWRLSAAAANGQPVPVGAYVVTLGHGAGMGYHVGPKPEPPQVASGISVRDVLTPTGTDLVPGSLTSNTALYDTGRKEIRWDPGALPAGSVELAYELLLGELTPAVRKRVSDETEIVYFDDAGREVRQTDGPYYIDVDPGTAALTINATADQYVAPQQAQLDVRFTPTGAVSGRVFGTAADLQAAELSPTVDAVARPGALQLAPDGAGYQRSGTAVFTVDAGGPSRWGELRFDAGFPDACTRLTHDAHVGSNDVLDVVAHEVPDDGNDGWLGDPTASWYKEAFDTVVDQSFLSGWAQRRSLGGRFFVVVPDSPALDAALGSSFTFEGWVWSAPVSSEPVVLFSKGAKELNGQVESCFVLYQESGFDPGTHHFRVRAQRRNSAGDVETWEDAREVVLPVPTVDPGDPEPNLWTHVAFVVREIDQCPGGGPAVEARFYVNGQTSDEWAWCGNDAAFWAEGMPRITPAPDVPRRRYEGELVLGADPFGSSGSPSSPDHSDVVRLDELRIHSDALTQSELAAVVASGRAHTPAPAGDALVAHWSFDDGPADSGPNSLGGRFDAIYVNVDGGGVLPPGGYIYNDAFPPLSGRSSRPGFPRKSLLIATRSSVDIIDASTRRLWMRIPQLPSFCVALEACQSGSDDGRLISGLAAAGGRVYVAGRTIGLPAPPTLSVINFERDRIWRIAPTTGFSYCGFDEAAHFTQSAPPVLIGARFGLDALDTVFVGNSGDGTVPDDGEFWPAHAGDAWSDSWSIDVATAGAGADRTDTVVLGQERGLAIVQIKGTDAPSEPISLRAEYTFLDTAPDPDEPAWPEIREVRLQPRQSGEVADLYFVQRTAATDTLHAQWAVPLIWDQTTTLPDLADPAWAPSASYGAGTPLATQRPDVLAQRIGDIAVAPGVSGARAGDNTLLLGTDRGLLRVEEHRVALGAGRAETGRYYRAADVGAARMIAGTSDDVRAVAVEPDTGVGGGFFVWTGTAAPPGGDPGLSIWKLGTGATADKRLTEITNWTMPRLGTGAVTAAAPGVAGTAGAGAIACSAQFAPPETAVRIETRSAPDPVALVGNDTLGWTPLRDVAAIPGSFSRFRGAVGSPDGGVLQVRVTLDRGERDRFVTPVLEEIALDYTCNSLAIDVAVEERGTVDAPGSPVALIDRVPLTPRDLGPGAELAFSRFFSTSTVAPGPYTARATLVDVVSGRVQAVAIDDFTVVGPPTGTALTSTIATERGSYAPGERVGIISGVANQTPNVQLEGVSVTLRVRKGAAEPVGAYSYRVDTLPPAGTHRLVQPHDLTPAHGPGTYTVEQEVNLGGTRVSLRTATFVVEDTGPTLAGLTGRIDATPSSVTVTGAPPKASVDQVGLDLRVHNDGNRDLVDLTLRVEVFRSSQLNAPVRPATDVMVASLPRAGSASFTVPFPVAGLLGGSYVAALSAVPAAGTPVPLDAGGFTLDGDAPAAEPPAYVVIDLDAQSGGGGSYAQALNADGDAVGSTSVFTGSPPVESDSRAVRWPRCGGFESIDQRIRQQVPTATSTSGLGINAQGITVGVFHQSGTSKAFRWDGSTLAVLPTVGGPYSQAVDINSLGSHSAAVGFSTLANPVRNVAARWRGSPAIVEQLLDATFRAPSPPAQSAAHAINDGGDVAGLWFDATGARRALVGSAGVLRDAGRLRVPAGAGFTSYQTLLLDINNSGIAVGVASDFSTNDRPVLARDGVLGELPRLLANPAPGQPATPASVTASALNDRATVAGTVATNAAPYSIAAAWIGGVLYDLNGLVTNSRRNCPSAPSSWTLAGAVDVNGDDVIVANAYRGTETVNRAVRLEPLGFPVSTLAGLRLWFRSDTDLPAATESGAAVTSWRSLTCQGELLPVATAPKARSRTCCRQPLVAFDATGGLSTAVSPAVSGASTLFLLVQTGTDDGVVLSSGVTADTDAFELTISGGVLRINHGPGGATSVPVSALQGGLTLLTLELGAQSRVYANGDLIRGVSLPTLAYRSLRLGVNRAGAADLQFGVGEAMLFEGTVDSVRRARIEQYLMRRFELTGQRDLSSPLAWFKGDAGVTTSGQNVTRWQGFGTASISLEQDVATKQPTFAAGDPVTPLACRESLRFDGVDDFLRTKVLLTDVFLVMDMSGSMGKNTLGRINLLNNQGFQFDFSQEPCADVPTRQNDAEQRPSRLDAAKTVAHRFARDLLGGDGVPATGHRAGVVLFDDDAETQLLAGAKLVTGQDTPPGRPDLLSTLCDLDALMETTEWGGTTQYKPALDLAHTELAGSTDRGKAVVFLSDGAPGDPGEPNGYYQSATALGALGARIYTVGFDVGTNSPAEAAMRAIASRGAAGGDYFPGTSADALAGAFDSILSNVNTNSITQATITATFALDGTAATDRVLLAMGDLANGLNVRVRDGTLLAASWATGPDAVRRFYQVLGEVRTTGANHLELTLAAPGSLTALHGTVNGAPLFAASISPGTLTPTLDLATMTVGGAPSGTRLSNSLTGGSYFRGWIGEVIVYARALTPEQLLAVRAYAFDKYGIRPATVLPPIAHAGPDQLNVRDTGWDRREDVRLNGSLSLDANPGAPALDDTAFRWYERGVEVASGKQPLVNLSLGEHSIELRVTTPAGATDSDTVVVTVKPFADSPLASWTFDRREGPQLVFDSGPNQLHLESNADETSYVPGRDGDAFEFNENQQMLTVMQPEALPVGNAPRTFMAWFEGHYQYDPWVATLFSQGTSSIDSHFGVIANLELVGFTVGREIRAAFGEFYGWHHLAVVIPHGARWSDQILMYVDGELVPTSPFYDGSPVEIRTGLEFAWIGRSNDWYGGLPHLGRVDEIVVHGRPLSVAEIREHMQRAPLGQWSMRDHPFSPLAEDSTGLPVEAGNFAELITVHPLAMWTGPGDGCGQSLRFEDGMSHAVTQRSPLGDNWDGVAFTITLRADGPDSSDPLPAIAQEDVGNLLELSAYQIRAALFNPPLEWEGDFYDACHHFAVTYHAESGEGRLYVDGELVAADSVEPLPFFGRFLFGMDAWYGATFEGGRISEVRVYGRELSEDEVRELAEH